MSSGVGLRTLKPASFKGNQQRSATQPTTSRNQNPVAATASSSGSASASGNRETKGNPGGNGNGNSDGDDPETLRLIAEMLQSDLEEAERFSQFERAQLEEVLQSSSTANSNSKSSFTSTSISNSIPSLESEQDLNPSVLYAQELLASNDRQLANALSKDLGIAARDHHLAQKLGAENSKLALDAEYARQLQALDESGRHDLDWDHLKNLEGVVSKEQMKEIMRQALGDFSSDGNTTSSSSHQHKFSSGKVAEGKGKGKAKEQDGFQTRGSRDVKMSAPDEEPQTLCEICGDSILICYDPSKESKKGSSSDTSLGMLMTTCRHKICHDDLIRHIDIKLNDAKGGQKKAFPMLCPLCPEMMTDDQAKRILGAGNMSRWEDQKLMDSLEVIYCPRKTCSAILSLDAFDQAPGAPTDATCPTCSLYFCSSCKVPFHRNLTCQQYQALPPGERDEEDRAVLDLAQQKNWRRCPQCQAIVELDLGCNHISCRCGKEFCYRCGSDWRSTPRNECTRAGTAENPKCPLYDEEMLLSPEARQQRRQQAAVQNPPVPAPAPAPQPQAPVLPLYIPPQQRAHAQPAIRGRRPPIPRGPHQVDPSGCRCHGDFYWLTEGPNGVMPYSKANVFTKQMLSSMSCGYCDQQFYSSQDLAHHLSFGADHRTIACCHRFYDSQHALDQHQNSQGCSFGARRGNDYSFLENRQVDPRYLNHATMIMLNGTCYYCGRDFNSPRALSQHLLSIGHPVYFCCDSFFDSQDAKEEHIEYFH